MTEEELLEIISCNTETEHLEFKSAEKTFNFDGGKKSILGYCVALSNEGGGRLILGVTDDNPRKICGTETFKNIQKLKTDIYNRLNRRVDVEEFITQDNKRVLILNIPSRPIGQPLDFDGIYLMRVGEELVPMTPEQLKKISNEATADYSNEIIPGTTINDLSDEAIIVLRNLLKASNRLGEKDIDNIDDEQLLIDLQLLKDGKLTIAALVLLGTNSALTKYLPYAEVRYNYKKAYETKPIDIAIFRKGYLLYYNELWVKINSRNSILEVPYGLTTFYKNMFDEQTIKEAINNAIMHRDYSEVHQTIIITQTDSNIEIVSPGGFLDGITIDNIINESKTRNRLIADVLYRCGFVDNFGYGVNLMIKNQLSSGKDKPDFSNTNKYSVVLKIDGKIKDIEFTKYIYKICSEKNIELTEFELQVLYGLKDKPKSIKGELIETIFNKGIVEKDVHGKYMLSKKYYEDHNKRGEYTIRKGIDRETNKQLIINYLDQHKRGTKSDFMALLKKEVGGKTVNKYLKELKDAGKVHFVGNPRIVKGKNIGYWELDVMNSK